MADTAQRLDLPREGPAYAEDYAAWVEHQVELLHAQRFDELDLENLTDEVGSLARSDFRAWVAAIRQVILHMLKWDYQVPYRSRSWQGSILEHRARIDQDLVDSPSYRARTVEAVAKAYPLALAAAVKQTRLPLKTFPETCPYDWAEITTREHPLPGDA